MISTWSLHMDETRRYLDHDLGRGSVYINEALEIYQAVENYSMLVSIGINQGGMSS